MQNLCRDSLTINGGSSFTLPSNIAFGNDYAIERANVYINGATYGGGAHGTQINSTGSGDTVVTGATVTSWGGNEGFAEGLEDERKFLMFNPYIFGGTVTLNGTDTVGHQKMQVVVGNSYNPIAGGDNTLIDVTKKVSPAGNVTSVSVYSGDSRFMSVTVDATLKASLNTALGTNYHQGLVVAGADMQKYNGACPSTAIGPWPQVVTPSGVSVVFNPYGTDYRGQGSQTTAQCVTVSGDFSTVTAGTMIGIWGAHDNWETAKVTSKPDATHIVVPLNFPHDAGEFITWGAGVGYGMSTDKSTIPAQTITTIVTQQYKDIHLTAPIVGWDSANSKLILWVLSSASPTELKLNIYTGVNALTPAIFTPTMSGGSVVSVSGNINNYYTASPLLGGILSVFPPPTLTFGGTGTCSVLPTFRYTLDNRLNSAHSYALNVVTGGSGCPADFSITAQSVYPNPIILYPTTRTYRIQDPITKAADSGFVLADALAVPAVWANGDFVEVVPNTQRYVSGNVQYGASPWVRNSARFGPAKSIGYLFPQDGTTKMYYTNQTDSKYYWGDATTGYMQSSDPTKATYATGRPPVWLGFGGAYTTGIYYRTPPYA